MGREREMTGEGEMSKRREKGEEARGDEKGRKGRKGRGGEGRSQLLQARNSIPSSV